MKIGIRIFICAVLVCVALTMAVFTAATFRRDTGPEGQFVLGEVDGNVAIFSAGNMKKPVTVTDIELGSLRETDRVMIKNGLITADQMEISRLLEDLGS